MFLLFKLHFFFNFFMIFFFFFNLRCFFLNQEKSFPFLKKISKNFSSKHVFLYFFIIEAETVLRLNVFFCGKGFFSTANTFFAVSGRFSSFFGKDDSLILLSRGIDLKAFYFISKNIVKLNMKQFCSWKYIIYKKLLLKKPWKIKKKTKNLNK